MRGLLGAVFVLGLANLAQAKSSPAGIEFFEQKIRPVLVEHCYSCHSTQAKKSRGGLRVDSRDALRRGGDSGPALVPGKPGASLLLKALRHDGLAMPPRERLSAAVVADFEKWISQGAPDPRDGRPTAAVAGIDLVKGRQFWAFQPPRRHPVPAVADPAWPRTPLDRFVLAALEARGLRPVGDAAPETLLRRLSLALTGLPPCPEEADAFLTDRSPDALERLVDRLLASPAYGERWGRHWLDVARYADSNGKDENLTFHEAYLFRDYVLGSFNRDKPFDQLVREQIAGDLLPEAGEEQLTGSGFLVLGPKVLADRDKLRRKMDVVDEQIDTVGRAFLGLTLGCARCHDHKFDPVPTTDYHALAGIFTSTRTLDSFKLGNPVVSGWMLRPLDAESAKRLTLRQTHDARLKKVSDQLRKLRAELKKKGEPRARERLAALEAEEKKLKAATPPAPRLVMAVRDEDRPADLAVAIRGNPRQLGPVVPRGFLTVASWEKPPTIPSGTSGRRELAGWLADRRNPLTARVFVNRVWKHLFGEGLVRTVDNLGAQGERPTHPELLDTLAVEFMDSGWSIKTLLRRIVLSRTYALAVARDERAEKVDPENRLLWRGHRRRLDAEVIRDSILAVAGTLDRSMGGTAVAGLGERAIDNASKGGLSAATEGNVRRSVYLPVLRNDLPALLEVFDFADPDVTTGRREATTVPTQALYFLNSPFVLEQARAAASRLLVEKEQDRDRVLLLYRRALGRMPAPEEVEQALAFVSGNREAWAALCQAVFACTEFRFVE